MLKTKIGGLSLQCCVYNSSGPRSGSIESLEKIGASRAGAILTKSATPEKREGNSLPRIKKIKLENCCSGSLNSEGLPNGGISYYTDPSTVSMLQTYNKPYIVSIAGLSLEDNVAMILAILQNKGINGIELNLACPNLPGKAVTGYNFEALEKYLRTIAAIPDIDSKTLGIKLPPYFDIPQFDKAAEIICKYPVQYVVCINSICNALYVDADNECPAIAPREGLGGLGGGFIKYTALANVRIFYKKFIDCGRPDIDIVGVGGVSTGRDAFEFILCGARAVQVGTCYWEEGPKCFERVARELQELMKSKGYRSIEDFRGQLKAWTSPEETISTATTSPTKPTQPNRRSQQLSRLIKDATTFQIIILALVCLLLGLLFVKPTSTAPWLWYREWMRSLVSQVLGPFPE